MSSTVESVTDSPRKTKKKKRKRSNVPELNPVVHQGRREEGDVPWLNEKRGSKAVLPQIGATGSHEETEVKVGRGESGYSRGAHSPASVLVWPSTIENDISKFSKLKICHENTVDDSTSLNFALQPWALLHFYTHNHGRDSLPAA